MSNVKKMRQAKLDMNWWDEMWEERIIGIVAKLGLLAVLFLYGCGDSSGRTSSRGEWENSLSRARQLERSVDVLLASASTNDLSRFLHGYVEGWEKSNQEIRESYRALPDSVRTVSNIKVRLELCGWIEKRVFENPHLRMGVLGLLAVAAVSLSSAHEIVTGKAGRLGVTFLRDDVIHFRFAPPGTTLNFDSALAVKCEDRR